MSTIVKRRMHYGPDHNETRTEKWKDKRGPARAAAKIETERVRDEALRRVLEPAGFAEYQRRRSAPPPRARAPLIIERGNPTLWPVGR